MRTCNQNLAKHSNFLPVDSFSYHHEREAAHTCAYSVVHKSFSATFMNMYRCQNYRTHHDEDKTDKTVGVGSGSLNLPSRNNEDTADQPEDMG